ncbi:MAG: hypothetical protein AAF467_24650 [Actinomycetota bacterium]
MRSIRYLFTNSAERAAIERLESAFGQLSIDDTSSTSLLNARDAYALLDGDTDPARVQLVLAQIRSKRERRALLRQLGADRIRTSRWDAA